MSLVTIGMPLYNNAQTLERALRSLEQQTLGDFTVIMSDDNSSDETVRLATEFCGRDSRFRLVRQRKNLNYGNFRFVLQQADSEFFMFAAGDDWWEPDFVRVCVAALQGNSQAVAAVTKVRLVADHHSEIAKGTRALAGSAAENISWFLRNLDDNSRMYGVFRTSIATGAFPRTDHHAYDWTFSLRTLLHGTHLELEPCLMHREMTPVSRYVDYVRRDGRGLWRVFPLLGMTIALLKTPRMLRLPDVPRALLIANLQKHLEYMRKYHPLYDRLLGPLPRLLMRKL